MEEELRCEGARQALRQWWIVGGSEGGEKEALETLRRMR